MFAIDDVRSTSDGTLAERALSDDGDAFAELYRRHVDKILRFHQRRVLDPHDAFDMTSETFAAALVSLDRFDPGRSEFVGWLHGIARNVWRRHVRDGRTDQRSRQVLAMTEVTVSVDDLERIEALVDSDSLAATIEPLLGELTPRLRDVVQLRVVEGLPTAEVAARLDLSEATVRKRRQRAMQQLAVRLDRRLVDGAGEGSDR